MEENKIVKKDTYLEALDKRVLVFDGAMGTMLQSKNLSAEDFGGESLIGCNDALVLFSPEAVLDVHRAYLQAGADVIETDTFRANRSTLADYGLQDRSIELKSKGCQLSQKSRG